MFSRADLFPPMRVNVRTAHLRGCINMLLPGTIGGFTSLEDCFPSQYNLNVFKSRANNSGFIIIIMSS